MGYKAIRWSMDQKVKYATAKIVLICLADFADNERFECWPSVSQIAEKTGQDRKTIMINLKRLVDLGLIRKTGNKFGATKSVPIYALEVEKGTPSSTNFGTTKQYQNRDRLEAEAVPIFPVSSTNVPPEAVPMLPAHKDKPVIEPVIEPVRERARATQPIGAIELQTVPLDPLPEWVNYAKTEKGIVGKDMENLYRLFFDCNKPNPQRLRHQTRRTIDEWQTKWERWVINERQREAPKAEPPPKPPRRIARPDPNFKEPSLLD